MQNSLTASLSFSHEVKVDTGSTNSFPGRLAMR